MPAYRITATDTTKSWELKAADYVEQGDWLVFYDSHVPPSLLLRVKVSDVESVETIPDESAP